MLKRLIALMVVGLMLGSAVVVGAGVVIGGARTSGGGETPGGGYDDIVFIFNCDSNTNNVAPTRGSGVMAIDAGMLLNTTDKIQGTGCLDQNNDGYDDFELQIDGNFDYTNSRIGFWLNPQEALSNAGRIIGSTNNQANGFEVVIDTVNKKLQGRYLNGTAQNNFGVLSTSTWHYIELKFTASALVVYVDGDAVTTINAGANSFTDTKIRFGASDNNAFDALYDEIRISNDKDRDLYAIRNTPITS